MMSAGTSSTDQRRASRAETLWRSVMREGRSIEEVAREHAVSQRRLEQLLFAFGRRRMKVMKVM